VVASVASNVVICVSACSGARCNRLPLPSCFGSQCLLARVVWHASAVVHDGVCAALHVVYGGHHTMAGLLGLAGGAGVLGLEANAVHPTVENNGTSSGYSCGIVDGDSGKCGMWGVIADGTCFMGNGANSGIGVLEASLSTSECFNMALVLFFEVCLEIHHGMLSNRLVFPFVDSAVEDTCVFEDSEHEAHGCGIGDGFSTSHGKELTIADIFPQVFEQLFRHPQGSEAVSVGIKVRRLDRTICHDEMCQHCLQCNSGKAHGFVFECCEVLGVDGLKDEFFEAFADVMVEAKCGKIGIIDIVELHELKLHQVSLIMQWKWSRMWQCRERGTVRQGRDILWVS